MSITKKLESYLKKSGVKYEIVVHPKTFTSQETAQADHLPGREIAKVVMVKADGKNIMLVLPASHRLDLFKLSTVLGTEKIAVEEEKDFQKLFPDCEVGAMPPLGHLYHLPCYVDKTLTEEKEIVFNGGTHTESVKLSEKDFEKLAHAEIGDFAVATGGRAW